MQLLIKFIFACSFLVLPYASAGEKCQPGSIKKTEILNCVAISYSIIDTMLNDRYKGILGKPDFAQKSLLVDSERLWVSYRDSRCKFVYDSIYPGEEAEIESRSCVLSLTYSRLLELIYIESSVRDTTLERFINNFGWREKYNSLVVNQPDFDGGAYFKKNCELVGALFGENESNCIRRMEIQNL